MRLETDGTPPMDWRDLDRAALSRAYDNSGAVADSAARLADWRLRSAALRARPGHTLDLPYDPGPAHAAGPRNRIDLFACGRAGAPLLAFIHGGYWQRNAKEGFACLAEGPLALGLDVALIGYTLAPEASLTRIADEIGAALRALRAHDAAAGLGRRRLVVSGWSAGGHLAALALDGPDADAGLAISGIYDLAPIRRTSLTTRSGSRPGRSRRCRRSASHPAAASPWWWLTGPTNCLNFGASRGPMPRHARLSRRPAASRSTARIISRSWRLWRIRTGAWPASPLRWAIPELSRASAPHARHPAALGGSRPVP